ncbi:MAG TPA: Ig-like domain-containing protein [Polyangiaceae bacterium]|jgi:hypothetical protein
MSYLRCVPLAVCAFAISACSAPDRSFHRAGDGGGGGAQSAGNAGKSSQGGRAGGTAAKGGTGGDVNEAGSPDEAAGAPSDDGGSSSGGTSSAGANSGGVGAGGAGSGGLSQGGTSGGGAANGGTSGVAGKAGSSTGGGGSAGSAGKGGSTGSGGSAGSAGKGGSGGTAGAGDTTAPTIVSISPTNNATGVKSNASITITFSEVMNSAAATQAMQVGGFTASDLNTSWDAAGKVLTVTPKTGGFAYANGSTPAGTPATKYTVTVGTGATDLAGNPLASVFSSSFTTLRHITQSIASGTAAAYSTYGHAVGDGPVSCPTYDPLWVDIWTNPGSGGTYYIFIPFDTSVMGSASSITLESASFSATQVAASGAFYTSHQVVLKRVTYQAIDKTVLDATVLDSFGVFASSAVAQPTANVFADLSADITANVRQEMFRLEPTGTADSGTMANFTCSGFYLNVVYTIP